MFKIVAERCPTAKNKWSVAIAYQKLGEIKQMQNQSEEAECCYTKGLQIIKGLTEENQMPENLQLMYHCLLSIGEIVMDRKDAYHAKYLLEKAFMICEQLTKENATSINLHHLAAICVDLGDIARVENDLESTEEWYLKALKICESLMSGNSQEETYNSLTEIYFKLGCVAMLHQKESEILSYAVKPVDCDKHIKESIEWYKKAADQGSQKARFALSAIDSDMSKYGRVYAAKFLDQFDYCKKSE